VSSLKRRRIFFEFGHSPQPYIGIVTPSPSQRWGVVMIVKKKFASFQHFTALRCVRVKDNGGATTQQPTENSSHPKFVNP
jgi:hypothetical protein